MKDIRLKKRYPCKSLDVRLHRVLLWRRSLKGNVGLPVEQFLCGIMVLEAWRNSGVGGGCIPRANGRFLGHQSNRLIIARRKGHGPWVAVGQERLGCGLDSNKEAAWNPAFITAVAPCRVLLVFALK